MISFLKKVYQNKNYNNSFWSSLDVILYPLVFIVTTPFFIQNLGAELFGIWLLMTTINVSLQVFNFGVGSALIFYTAKYLTEQKTEKLYQIFNSILSLSFLLFPIILFFAYLLSLVFLKTDFFNVSLEYQSLAVKSVYVSAIIAVLKIIQTFLMSILNGKEVYKVNTVVNTISRVLILLLGLALVLLGYSVFEILLVSAFINLISVMVYYINIKKHFEGFHFQFQIIKTSIEEILSYSFWVWMQSIFATISFQLDKFFVTAISGPTILVYYSLSSTIVNQMHMVFGALSAWLFPRISSLLAQGKEFVSLYITVRSLVLFFAYTCILVLILIKKQLLTLWIGAENTEIMLPLFNLFLVYQIIYTQTILPSFFLQGIKKVKLSTFYTVSYKFVVIIGITIAYFTDQSVQDLLLNIAIPLYFVLPILHFIMNKKSVQLSALYESFFIFVPAYLLAAIVFVESLNYRLLLIGLFSISLYLVYVRKIKLKDLKEVEN